MAEVKTIGDSQPLGKSPVTPPTNGGSAPNAQIIGDRLPLGTAPVLPPFHRATANGQVQQVGDSLPMSNTPQKPWSQAKLPESTLTNMGGK